MRMAMPTATASRTRRCIRAPTACCFMNGCRRERAMRSCRRGSTPTSPIASIWPACRWCISPCSNAAPENRCLSTRRQPTRCSSTSSSITYTTAGAPICFCASCWRRTSPMPKVANPRCRRWSRSTATTRAGSAATMPRAAMPRTSPTGPGSCTARRSVCRCRPTSRGWRCRPIAASNCVSSAHPTCRRNCGASAKPKA